MIAPDANLLIYAYQSASPLHAEARRWLEDLFSNDEPVGIPMLSAYAFLRFLTDRRISPSPITYSQASSYIESWLELSHVRIIYPGDRHLRLMRELSRNVRISGSDVTDLAIAAIAIEYGAVVHTHDRDFARFQELRWHDPLAG